MPNTLAHAGVQGLASRTVWRSADLKWVYLGCVIPDIPWILQRIVRVAVPHVDLYALRAYATVQSSLLSCLIICAAVGLLTREFWRTYALLSVNVLLHLLLDALQTKWANGVHFLAPFSWEFTNWGFFWPESFVTYGITGIGLIYIVAHWGQSVRIKPDITPPTNLRTAGIILLSTIYLTAPIIFIQQPISANNHYIRTLEETGEREGKYIEFDRVSYIRTPDGKYLAGWNSELIGTTGLDIEPPATVSIQGVFVNAGQIRVLQYHVHHDWFRNAATYLGLGLIFIVWMVWALRSQGEWLYRSTAR
jgi:hypothetical protein